MHASLGRLLSDCMTIGCDFETKRTNCVLCCQSCVCFVMHACKCLQFAGYLCERFSTQKSMRHLSFIDLLGDSGAARPAVRIGGRRWSPLASNQPTPNLTGSLAFALVSKLSQVHVDTWYTTPSNMLLTWQVGPLSHWGSRPSFVCGEICTFCGVDPRVGSARVGFARHSTARSHSTLS
jgi:hypothetical protein